MTKEELEKATGQELIEQRDYCGVDGYYGDYLDDVNAEMLKRFNRLADIEKENAELKGEADSVLDNWCKGDDPCPHLKKRDDQLTKAKFLLKQLVDAFPKSYSDVVKDTLDEARKFVEE